ncbi:MAG: MFS transporter [Candidatus Rokuibacteriota bacterium]|nr:MAG: MFS transporter [Candidatus Rokubacteria bacterium]
MRFPHGLRALNHRDFRRFYAAQLLALVGGWMQTVAQAWLVLQLTDSPFKLGLISTLQFSPILMFSLVAGAVADRLPKRGLLVTTQTTLACQALLLGALVSTGRVQYGHVAVLGLVLGFANAVDQPARQSFVMDMVGKGDVANAVALNSAAFNAARIVGPAVAGVLIGRVGVGPVFFINSVGFVGVILTLLRLEARGLPARERRATMLEEIVEGLRYARRTPRLLLALGLVLSVSLFVFNFTVYVPLLARTVLGLGAEGFGFLMASLGVGAVAGALTVGGFGSREPELGRMFLSAAVAFAALLGLGLSRHAWTAAPLLFVTGYFGIMLMATCNTSMQLRAPDALRGRVMSLYTWVTGGVFPIGAFLVGSISQAWGVSAAFLWNGTLGLVTLGGIMLWWRLRARAPRPV